MTRNNELGSTAPETKKGITCIDGICWDDPLFALIRGADAFLLSFGWLVAINVLFCYVHRRAIILTPDTDTNPRCSTAGQSVFLTTTK